LRAWATFAIILGRRNRQLSVFFPTEQTVEESEMKKTLFAIAALAALLGAPAAVAADVDTGLYVGVGVGQSFVNTSVGDVEIDFDLDDEDMAWKGLVGYRIGKHLGVELAYRDLGATQSTDGDASIETDQTAFDLQAMGMLPVGPFDVFAKFGVASWDADGKWDNGIDPPETGSDDGTDMMWGLGAQFRLGSIGIRLEYEDIDAEGFDDLYTIMAGATFTF